MIVGTMGIITNIKTVRDWDIAFSTEIEIMFMRRIMIVLLGLSFFGKLGRPSGGGNIIGVWVGNHIVALRD